MTCPNCNNTGRYVGLNSIEVCRTCGGVEVTVHLARWALIDVTRDPNSPVRWALQWHTVDASENWQPGHSVFSDVGREGRVIRNTHKATMSFLGLFVRWATPEECG